MLPRPARFTGLLAANGIAGFGRQLPAGEEGPVVVDRVGRRAFLALCHGPDTGFESASLSRGPVSGEMADGVCKPAGEDGPVHRAAVPDMPAPFMASDFLGLASGRSAKWMCAASTMLLISINYRKNLAPIMSRAEDLAWHSSVAVDDAFSGINGRGMFRLDQ